MQPVQCRPPARRSMTSSTSSRPLPASHAAAGPPLPSPRHPAPPRDGGPRCLGRVRARTARAVRAMEALGDDMFRLCPHRKIAIGSCCVVSRSLMSLMVTDPQANCIVVRIRLRRMKGRSSSRTHRYPLHGGNLSIEISRPVNPVQRVQHRRGRFWPGLELRRVPRTHRPGSILPGVARLIWHQFGCQETFQQKHGLEAIGS